jgi:hypothetical protein
MSKYVIKFGKKNITLELSDNGFYISKLDKNGIAYICSANTAETGNGKTYAIEVGEDDNYEDMLKTCIAIIKELEKETV